MLSYSQAKYEIAFFKGASSQYGLRGKYDGTELAVEGGKGKKVKVIPQNKSDFKKSKTKFTYSSSSPSTEGT